MSQATRKEYGYLNAGRCWKVDIAERGNVIIVVFSVSHLFVTVGEEHAAVVTAHRVAPVSGIAMMSEEALRNRDTSFLDTGRCRKRGLADTAASIDGRCCLRRGLLTL